MSNPKSPWSWIPTLYFAEGLPYVAVMTISVIMYKKLGISNTDIALYTSYLYLPWVIKPFWSPFIDMFRTKRFWVVAMQFCIGLGLAGVALTIPTTSFFQYSIAIFWLMAFSSATHDIAADGFYLLGLPQHQQAAFNGIRSTFYRLAMIAGQGALVVFAGEMERTRGIPAAWSLSFFILAGMFFLFFLYHWYSLPRPDADRGVLEGRVFTGKDYFKLFGGFLGLSLSLILLWLIFFSVIGYASRTFAMPSVFIPVLTILGLVSIVFLLTRTTAARYVEREERANAGAVASPFVTFLKSFVVFLRKDNIGIILTFLLLFRFAEAQLVKLVQPFLLDSIEQGGLGLTTSEVGIAYGTVGVASLLVGGILGGLAIARFGLKRMIWFQVAAIHLPDLMFVYLSHVQPANFAIICTAIGIEQFGYGFGFASYMMFMIMTSEGEYKTAHYAICTGIMALGMMIPGMWSGWLEDQIGYANFFIWVIISTIPGFLVPLFVKIDPEFGKKRE